MKAFLDDDFLLGSKTAKDLYHDYAAPLPIIDYHCHVSPMEIAQNRRFANITQIWLGSDHYKWRLIRANGEKEALITGTADDYDKFLAFARALPKAMGNPVYHWTHLELKRYFDCSLPLSPDTADEIWALCNRKLTKEGMSVKGIISQSQVTALATTDDPADTLEWHRAIAADSGFKTKVVPAFRPDKAVNIDRPGFAEYVLKLEAASGTAIQSFDSLLRALESRIAFFAESGCRAADHGLDYVPYIVDAETKAAAIFEKAMNGADLTTKEAEQYKTALMLFFGRQYARHDWVMQLHYGASRNVNTPMFAHLGPDTGYDAISGEICGNRIAPLLDALECTGELPKTLLFSLNANDDAMLDTIAGCFPGEGTASKVQRGSAWWYNDTKSGVESQLTGLASRGLLGSFVGMLTDSRCFLSYTRHEYFRRILCNIIGDWVEKGVFHGDIQIIKSTSSGSAEPLRAQDCVYTVLLRGRQNGETHIEKRIVTSVAGVTSANDDFENYAAFAKRPDLRFVISNTTEAGIAYDENDKFSSSPPKSFPGKLTRFLFERYEAFRGAEEKGLILLPVELIDRNGTTLRECCLKCAELWNLPEGFKSWLTRANTFCNTLVDRIITGYPEGEEEALWQEFGYEDKKIVAGEPYALWVIESETPEAVEKEFPLDKAGLPIIFTDNLQPYRERKVRVLNGAHTAAVFAAYLSGLDTVGDIMTDHAL
ncbi:MAG: glucuronate isomerase, partial [Peptococcaceae bacterium]|nr:glucuronate isomerase [Peptococcaceae bacterium]